jgi:competence protein ComEC
MHAYFLDVGQGDCTLVRTPDQHTYVIDCADAEVLVECLKQKNVRHIDGLICSHLDVEGAGRELERAPK